MRDIEDGWPVKRDLERGFLPLLAKRDLGSLHNKIGRMIRGFLTKGHQDLLYGSFVADSSFSAQFNISISSYASYATPFRCPFAG